MKDETLIYQLVPWDRLPSSGRRLWVFILFVWVLGFAAGASATWFLIHQGVVPPPK